MQVFLEARSHADLETYTNVGSIWGSSVDLLGWIKTLFYFTKMVLSSSCETSLDLAEVLEKLSEIALQLHQCSNVDALLAYGAKQLREIFGCDRTLVYQFLPNGDGVVIAESVADGWQPILGQLICDPCFQNKWMEPYRQGRVRAIPDVERSGLDPCHIDLLTQAQVKANLVAPIVVKSSTDEETHLWGLAIAQQCSAPRIWDALHIQVIKQVAMQIGIALDYLEIRQSFNHIQDREIRWRAALEGAEEGVWDWNVETNEVFFSSQWKAMLGYEADEIGNNVSEMERSRSPRRSESGLCRIRKIFLWRNTYLP
ncbi:GAF domain-containing protein [bacterium]|nr:GAF domain-containing protein [bacterium]